MAINTLVTTVVQLDSTDLVCAGYQQFYQPLLLHGTDVSTIKKESHFENLRARAFLPLFLDCLALIYVCYIDVRERETN